MKCERARADGTNKFNYARAVDARARARGFRAVRLSKFADYSATLLGVSFRIAFRRSVDIETGARARRRGGREEKELVGGEIKI